MVALADNGAAGIGDAAKDSAAGALGQRGDGKRQGEGTRKDKLRLARPPELDMDRSLPTKRLMVFGA